MWPILVCYLWAMGALMLLAMSLNHDGGNLTMGRIVRAALWPVLGPIILIVAI